MFTGALPKPILLIVVDSGTFFISNFSLFDIIASNKVNLMTTIANTVFIKFDKILLLVDTKFGKKNTINNGDNKAKPAKANRGFGATTIQVTKYNTKNTNGILLIIFSFKLNEKKF